MMNFLLIIIILLLLLILTGSFVGAVILGLKSVGWIIVVLLCVVLLWRLASPAINWIEKHKEINNIKSEIKRRKFLGYETGELEMEINNVYKKYDKSYQMIKEKRRKLGYDE